MSRNHFGVSLHWWNDLDQILIVTKMACILNCLHYQRLVGACVCAGVCSCTCLYAKHNKTMLIDMFKPLYYFCFDNMFKAFLTNLIHQIPWISLHVEICFRVLFNVTSHGTWTAVCHKLINSWSDRLVGPKPKSLHTMGNYNSFFQHMSNRCMKLTSYF